MSSVILGLSGALGHDPSAALLVDGELVAAAEEERFNRDKHAKNQLPREAAAWCLADAGIAPADVDVVAFPYAPIGLSSPARWHFARRYWYAPDRALDALFNGNRRFRRNRNRVKALCDDLGIPWSAVDFVPVEHHLAHASSAYHLAPFGPFADAATRAAPAAPLPSGKVAILGVDGKGEYATTFFGYGEAGRINRIKEFYDPDSLSGVYGAMTEFLGFEMLDGEYKVMGMAPYGDAQKYDLSRLIAFDGHDIQVNTRLVNTVGLRRHKDQGQGFYFSDALLDWLGPRRQGDIADEPYIHYAAAMQKLYEDRCLALIEAHLGDVLRECGRLVFAGGGALNVKLNQRILALPYVNELFVQPAAGDSGTALGAATYAAVARNERPAPLRHVYLGPRYDNAMCRAAADAHEQSCQVRQVDNIADRVADLLTKGHPVAWFQGRMEFGPRALGSRSILGCPSVRGVADTINAQIKFRERWRPFCPSLLPEEARAMTGSEHAAPYMTITFDVDKAWARRVPEVVHEDGTARIQIVDREANPRYAELLDGLRARTGAGIVLNTSLNRRGEPMICSPTDALNMFFGSDLQFLAMEDLLVTKRAAMLDA